MYAGRKIGGYGSGTFVPFASAFGDAPSSPSPSFPPPIDDERKLVRYSWIPHSTALGQSTVAVGVRSASLNLPRPAGVGGYGSGPPRRRRAASTAPPDVREEKKAGEGGTDGVYESDGDDVGSGTPAHVGGAECRVEAAVHAYGLPLQAAPVSTRYASLVEGWERDDDDSSFRWIGGGFEGTATETAETSPSRAEFGAVVSLPVRWRDLSRDACVAFNVYREGVDEGDDGSNLFGDGGGGGDVDVDGPERNPTRSRVWGATLPLFDESGRMRAGIYKLKLHPDVAADGGMGYEDDTETVSTESFLHGGSTPGVSPDLRDADRFRRWEEDEGEEEDPKWRASLILHDLNRVGSSATAALGTAPSAAAQQQQQAIQRPHPQRSASISWLDALTRERCLDVLRTEDDRSYGYDDDDDDDGDDGGHNGGGDGRAENSTPAVIGGNGDWSPASSLHRDSYLIVELPTPPLPVLHEEPLYPVEGSTYLRGASGSVTARDLAAYHAQFWMDEEEKENAACEKEKAKNSDGKQDESKSNADGRTSIPGVVKLSPRALIEADAPRADVYPLIQLIDHEPPLADESTNPEDNPYQDKYRILAHDLIRGFVDPGLKPDRAQRARLERIVGSPSLHLSTEEQDLVWRFRFSLVDNRRALTKFLLAVDWTVESEVVQAAELLEQWRKRSPIEVTDALKLLGRNVAFQTSLVRSYAIDTLSKAPDDELRLYLLQLVQALKYEEDVSSGVVGGAFPQQHDGSDNGGGKPSFRVSSLATFLIDRASRNIELANFLYWYLKVEMQNPNYEARYREVFVSFREKLSLVRVKHGSIVRALKGAGGDNRGCPGLSEDCLKAAPEQSTIVDVEPILTLWDLLHQQDLFISGIMECQKNSRMSRGKKDAKEAYLREELESGGFRKISHAVPLPSAPHIFVKGVNPGTARMFKSALYPAVIEFLVDSVAPASSVSASKSRPKQSGKDLSTYKVMIKTGDDLRQDQLVIMMIQLMDGLLKRGTLDLCLKPYSIMAMSQNTGLVEFVDFSIPVSQILANHGNSIMAFFQHVAWQEGVRHSVKPDVLQTYTRSCAGYCVLTYILGVGDRHLDNIMIQPSGHFFHIDFGFIFGRDPKPLPPAFRLTKEMVDGMGGMDSSEYRQFCSLACQAFNVLRKSAGLVLNLLHLMSDAGIEDLSNHPSADAIGVISKVEERFRLELTDEQAEAFFLGLINESVSALAPRVMEMFHQLSVARR